MFCFVFFPSPCIFSSPTLATPLSLSASSQARPYMYTNFAPPQPHSHYSLLFSSSFIHSSLLKGGTGWVFFWWGIVSSSTGNKNKLKKNMKEKTKYPHLCLISTVSLLTCPSVSEQQAINYERVWSRSIWSHCGDASSLWFNFEYFFFGGVGWRREHPSPAAAVPSLMLTHVEDEPHCSNSPDFSNIYTWHGDY